MHRRVLLGCGLVMLCVALACQPATRSEPTDPTEATELGGLPGPEAETPVSWQDFPLLLINVPAKKFVEVAPYVDAVIRYGTCDTDANDPFHLDAANGAKERLLRAKEQGLKLAVHLFSACKDANEMVISKSSWDENYADEWLGLLTAAIQEVIAYEQEISPDEALIAYWYGIEELRWWVPAEYRMQVGLYEAIQKNDPLKRPLISYLPNHYDDMRKINNQIDPNNKDDLKLDANGQLVPLQQHILFGNYTSLVIKDYGRFNRSWARHRVAQADAARTAYETRYAQNGQEPLPQRVFHVPSLMAPQTDPTQAGYQPATSPAQARHDFWSGIVAGANGIYIYNHAYTDDAPAVWQAYSAGLALIKQEEGRRYLTRGEDAGTLSLQINFASSYETIPACSSAETCPLPPGCTSVNDCLWDLNQVCPNKNACLAACQEKGYASLEACYHPYKSHFPVPAHPALAFIERRIGNTIYLFVVHSYQQDISFSFYGNNAIDAVQTLINPSPSLLFTPGGFSFQDSFDGTDARVYRITLAQ